MLNVKIITPAQIAKSLQCTAVILPTVDGEITILQNHIPLLTLLTQGVITCKTHDGEEYISIGSGFAQTDGRDLNILVSRAFDADAIDEVKTREAMQRAAELLKNNPEGSQKQELTTAMRHSMFDLKLLKKRKKSTTI